MKRCIVICPLWDGCCLEELTPQPGDLLLCADAGYRAALTHGLQPALVIGDFDTAPFSDETGLPVKRLSAHKDDTDLAVCLQEGRRRGYTHFVLAGCIGGRVDHTIACIQSMTEAAEQGISMIAMDAMNRMTVLTPGEHHLKRCEGRLLSLLSLTDSTRDVCLTGTEWELDHAVLTNRVPLGISNVILEKEAVLRFSEGLLLCCASVNRTASSVE